MNEIIMLLMQRDNISSDEAKAKCLNCKSKLEEVLKNELNLSLDYLLCFMKG